VNASPCVLPGSKLWLVRERRFLTPRECLALQGIWATDFLALDRWAHQPGKMTLLRDLAGNAFSTPVCMTVCLAVIMTAA
jgi:site-specific DNA-cytosine methylase